MSAIEFNPPDAEIVDFKVISEDWQYYKLSDGTKMKMKLLLTQVLRARNQVDQTGQPLYSWNTQLLMSVVSIGEGLKGTPTPIQITPEVVASNFEATVDFEPIGKQDEWAVYNLSDETVLRLRLNLNAVSRSKLRGPLGDPMYSVSAGMPNYRIKVHPELVKKPVISSSSKSPSHTYG